MIKPYVKTALLAFFIGISFISFAQNIAINQSGNVSANPTAVLDLSDASNNQLGTLLTNVSLNANNSILPFTSAPATGLIVWNTNAAMTGGFGVGFYYWSGAAWIYILNSGGASSGWNTTGNAGTNPAVNYAGTSGPQDFVMRTNATERMRFMSTGAAGLGTPTPKSAMDVNGNMSLGTYAGVTAAPANGMIISGQVGIGNNAPATSSVLDLTNTMATGGTGAPLVWPSNPNPTANIATPVLGEQIFNTTTGCFNFYNGAAWVVLGCPCTSAPASPTITASCAQALQGSTITYTSSITTGVTYNWVITSTTGSPTVSANGLSSITVTWPSTGANTGTVTLSLTNLCGTTTTVLSVPINNPSISGTTPVATNSTGNVYTVSTAGATYSWSSNNTWGVIVGSTTGQSVSVNAGSTGGSFTLQCIVSFGSCTQTVTYAVTVQSCGTITLDNSVDMISTTTTNTFSINTTVANELIIVCVDECCGTNSATVTGTTCGASTQLGFKNGSDGTVAMYCLIPTATGAHTISITWNASSTTYCEGFAASFKGFCSLPTAGANITISASAGAGAPGPPNITCTVTPPVANSYIFANYYSYNCGAGTQPVSWTNVGMLLGSLYQPGCCNGWNGAIGGVAYPTTVAVNVTGTKTAGSCGSDYNAMMLLDIHN